ncbi:MAG: hypothetical protein KGL39_50220 [Patescibacteria group bacterium]|nr:hypothetical protein [Patescibacteria group bacterium]
MDIPAGTVDWPIRLQFCSFPTIADGLIEWFTQGNVGHVDAVLPDGSLLGSQSSACGGKPAGVQIRPAGYDGLRDPVIVEFPGAFPQVLRSNFWGFLRLQIGKPYDMEAIRAFVAGRDWRAEDSWFCSELIAAALEGAYVFPARTLWAACNKITPEALLLACSVIVTPRAG